MSMHERTGLRDLLYSGWHRSGNLRRYLGILDASRVTVIDIDWCEYCCRCKQPVALIETEQSSQRTTPKPAVVTSELARAASLPAYSVTYTADADGTDITSFLVRQLVPVRGDVQALSPQAYALWLLGLRETHRCEEVRVA